MKKMKMILAALLALMMLLTASCGSKSLLVGTWTDASEQNEMTFDGKGNVAMKYYGISLPGTYEFDGETLTIHYTETITQTGTLTFFGDNEFCWENADPEGNIYQDYYTRIN